MGMITDNLPRKKKEADVQPLKSFKDTKKFISEQFYQGLNKYTVDENGNYVTYLQQMVDNTIKMAIDPEKDDYVKLAATKFITEHLEGKASAMSEKESTDLPKLVICVQGMEPESLRKNITELEGVEPKEDVVVEISDLDGTNKEEMLV